MVLEGPLDLSTNCNRLHRITHEIANHANAARMGQLDEDGEVRAMLFEGRVRRMPDPLPAKNTAARLDLSPFRIEGVAIVAEPLRPKLPVVAMGTALYQQPVLA